MPYAPENVTVPAKPDTATGANGAVSPDTSGPLLTVSRYQQITGDTTSATADVTQAIKDALDMSAHECNRTWQFGRYTEDLYLYKNGMVFPSATPIDLGQAIFSGGEIFDPNDIGDATASVVQGAGIWVGWFTPLPWMPVWTGVIPPQTVITYWGGYQQATVPFKLASLWSRIAWYILHPVVMPGLPLGAKSTGVGGVSIGGDLSSITAHDPQIRRDLRRFERRQGRHWQS